MKWLLVIAGIAANAGASALLKTLSAHPSAPGLIGYVANWRLILSLGLYGLAFLAYAAAVQQLPLNVAHPVSTAGAIVLVGLISAFIFHEGFDAARLIGYGLLLVGALVLAIAPRAA